MGIKGTYFNIIKVIYDKPKGNIIHNGENLKIFPLSGTRQAFPCLSLTPNTVLKVMSQQSEKKKK